MGPFLAFIPSILNIIDKIIPDKSASDKAKADLLMLQAKGQLTEIENQFQIQLKQLAVNAAEVSQPNAPKFGWRSLVGYGCAFAFIFNFLLFPSITYLAVLMGLHAPAPLPLDMASLMTLLTGMLGLGGMKTYENYQRMSLDRPRLFNSLRAKLGNLDQKTVDAVNESVDEQRW